MSIVRIINITVIILVVGFVGFFFTFALGFGGASKIYIWMSLVSTIALIWYVFLFHSQELTYARLNRFALVYVGLCLLAIGVKEAYTYYIKSITIANVELDLSQYRPFLKDTKAVALVGTATLKIKDDFPLMDGATALYPLYAAFGKAVYSPDNHPNRDNLVECTTTSFAYDNLINERVDVIFVAKPSQAQLDSALKKSIKLQLTPIGREAFVFFVNSRNKINELKLTQIRQIYHGTITNWNQVGGNNDKIAAFQRPEGSGSQTMLINVMNGLSLITPPKHEVPALMGGIVSKTADYENHKSAIGFSFLFYLNGLMKNNNIKILAIDGVIPNRTTISNGSYPISTSLYAVTTQNPSVNTQKLIKWITGPQGQSLVERTGYIPLK